MTAKGTTKQEILDAALEIFSVQGYEATSISQLAEAVGIRKASLYSHFENKQAILDALIQTTIGEYEKHSIFANADRDDPAFTKDKENMTPEMAAQMFLGQICYILHDPKISRARKMLTIEQFQNSQMASLQTKQNYTDVMHYFTGLVRFLIRQGRLADSDPEIMVAQLCLPISMWLGLCDREPERENDVMKLIEWHKAANVDEAVALLRQYDMNSSIGSAHHLSIADSQGKSVVVEYINGEMLVTETKVVTNHYLSDCEKQGIGSEQSHKRYDTLASHTGPADADEVRDLLESVAQKNYPQTADSYEKTMWSIVYCPEKRCADFYFAENYAHSYELMLSEKDSFLKR